MSYLSNLCTAVQARLQELGYYRLKIDGVPGPGTSEATIRFKEAHGLRARDFVGPITLDRLFSEDAEPWTRPAPRRGEPPWLTEARGLLGVRETPGVGNTARIMEWARNLDQWYPGDDTPWCGLFVAHCLAVGAPDQPQDFNRLGAREWGKFGIGVSETNPPLGAICTLWRGSRSGWKGHVFIVTGQSRDAIRGIGGNQGDAVSEDWFSRGRVLECRLPVGVDLPPAPMAPTGHLSRNEA